MVFSRRGSEVQSWMPCIVRSDSSRTRGRSACTMPLPAVIHWAPSALTSPVCPAESRCSLRPESRYVTVSMPAWGWGPTPSLPGLATERPEVVQEHPGAHAVAVAERQRPKHGEGPHGRNLGLDHLRHRAGQGRSAVEDRAHRLSTLKAPGPKATTISMPPMIDRFFRKWICIAWAWAGSMPQNR